MVRQPTRCARQPAPHMEQVGAGETVSHNNRLYNTKNTTLLVKFLNAYMFVSDII